MDAGLPTSAAPLPAATLRKLRRSKASFCFFPMDDRLLQQQVLNRPPAAAAEGRSRTTLHAKPLFSCPTKYARRSLNSIDIRQRYILLSPELIEEWAFRRRRNETVRSSSACRNLAFVNDMHRPLGAGNCPD